MDKYDQGFSAGRKEAEKAKGQEKPSAAASAGAKFSEKLKNLDDKELAQLGKKYDAKVQELVSKIQNTRDKSEQQALKKEYDEIGYKSSLISHQLSKRGIGESASKPSRGMFDQEYHYNVGKNTSEQEAIKVYKKLIDIANKQHELKSRNPVKKAFSKDKFDPMVLRSAEHLAKTLKKAAKEKSNDTGNGHLVAAFGHAYELAEDFVAKNSKQQNESASAGATSAGAVASVANPPKGKKKKSSAYNPDGTIKNALDTKTNVVGGKPVKR